MTRLGIVTALAFVVAAAASDLSGKWEIEATFDDNSLSGGGFDCAFKQEGERLSGNCMGVSLNGEVKGTRVSWQMKAGRTEDTISYTATLNDAGTGLSGRFSVAGKGGRFTGSKQ
jgi:hypothetical protein